MTTCIRSPIPWIVLMIGSMACASSPQSDGSCDLTPPSTADWVSHDEGAFTVRLPADYTRASVQGIDSRVGRWEAPGKRVSYDFGAYSNPLQPNDLTPFPGLVVCQEGDGDGGGTPRIIRYSPAEGGEAIAAHWAGLRRQAPGMTLSLTVEGVVQRPEDLGELLAIVRSVQVQESAEAAPGDTDPTAPPDAAAAEQGPDRAGYRAAGNEPFWLLTFDEATMTFSNLGEADTVRAGRPEPERTVSGWRFAATAEGQPFVVEVEDRRCSDSMSGRPFPHTVSVTVGGRTFNGCGGETMDLLTGEEWRVTRLDGAQTIGAQRPTLSFAADGALTGTGGCNRYRSTYEITGEGIEIGPALATRMACVDEAANAQETRFFALLEQVTRFRIADDGSLELLAIDRPVITAQR